MERQTTFATAETVDTKWFVIDAEGQVLGRMATEIATILMGKHKPIYTPHVDTGDYVIVLNAEKVVMTGNKWNERVQRHYSGYPGGQRLVSYGELRETQPERVIELAVTRMLPKNKLGRQMAKKLKVYAGSEHPHAAQQPEALSL